MRYVALLRGINVGGHRKVPMAELRELGSELGFEDVWTYIQSGNVGFETEVDPAALASLWSDGIRARWGHEVPVMVCTAARIAAALDHAFADREEDLRRLHVVFLSGVPEAGIALDPDRSPPDQYVLRGDRIDLWLPKGAAKSKLTNGWFERKLGVAATGRNLKTVQALAARLA